MTNLEISYCRYSRVAPTYQTVTRSKNAIFEAFFRRNILLLDGCPVLNNDCPAQSYGWLATSPKTLILSAPACRHLGQPKSNNPLK
jgi:hypothetical protein